MFRNRAVSAALVGLFVWVTGCTSYHQIDIGEVADHGQVRVTLNDGARETLRDPRVEADSIKGLGKVPLSIPLDQVIMLQSREHDDVKLFFLVLGLLAVTVVVAFATTCGEDNYVC